MAKFYIIRNGDNSDHGPVRQSDTVVQRGDGDFSVVLLERDGKRVYRTWRGAAQHDAWEGERAASDTYAAVEAVEACSLEHALEIAKRDRWIFELLEWERARQAAR